MMCDMDELMVALAEARVARDRIARQLPDGYVQDTRDQTTLTRNLNAAFVHLTRAVLDIRLAVDEYLQAQIIVDITPERRR